ncbi:hypothetical protein DFS34DRAFT_448101 [Phlyctochytrium arcticum]|nr:hypothetical protein DFS34DRAFT_448101 [Phlyctochytrium arcticum]
MSFLNDSLPALGPRGVSISSSRGNKERHGAATSIRKNLQLLDRESLSDITSEIWMRTETGISWGSEGDIKSLVGAVLRDTLRILGFQKQVRLQEELTMFGTQKADFFYLLNTNNAPIGVIEVKKPGNDVLDNDEVQGQIFDYMLALKQFQGLQHVYGILTTYEDWRICWLSDSDTDAAEAPISAPLISDGKGKAFQMWGFLPEIPTWGVRSSDHAVTKEATFTPPFTGRTLSTTGSFRFDDKRLPLVLATAVCKMASSAIVPPNLSTILNKRFALCLKPQEVTWSTRVSTSPVDFNVLPHSSSEEFYLLADLHGGGDGHAWLACNSAGRGCVVKVYQGANSKDEATFESDLWNKLWNASSFVRRSREDHFLVMPYVQPVSIDSQPPDDPAVRSATVAAIKSMAGQGYWHRDLKWAHVGLYRTPQGELRAILFDLVRVTSGCDSVRATEAMLKDLKIVLDEAPERTAGDIAPEQHIVLVNTVKDSITE